MVERIGWQIRLWLVGFGERVTTRARRLRVFRATFAGPFARFTDRVSPWTDNGYKRTWLRRLLYHVRYLPRAQRIVSLRIVGNIVYSFAPLPRPGRFEGMDPQTTLKAEWLDEHTEYADITTGESEDFGMWAALFINLDVPWSNKAEEWLLTVDSQGFVGVEEGGVEDRFYEIERDYHRWMTTTNPEGDPTAVGRDCTDDCGPCQWDGCGHHAANAYRDDA